MDNIIDENVGNEWTSSGIIYENLCLEVLTNMSREVEGPFEPGLYGLTISYSMVSRSSSKEVVCLPF